MAIQQFNTVAELRSAIRQLEIKQANEWPPLKEQLLATAETLKPKHILKGTIKEIFSEPGLKTLAVNTSIGLAAVLATKYLFPAKAASLLNKLVTGAMVGVTSIRSIINRNQIKSKGNDLPNSVSNHQSTPNA